MTSLQKIFLICLATSVPALADARAEFYLETGAICINTEDPRSCMESYGFRCHRVEVPSVSFKAYAVGCNLILSEDRRHYVQMLNKNGEWNIESERTTDPDVEIITLVPDQAELELTAYIRTEMDGYRITSNGGSAIEGAAVPLRYEEGARKFGEEVTIRSVCGVTSEKEPDENLARLAKAECQKILLHGIMLRSQFSADSPYRAAGANEIYWESTTMSLAPDSVALILDGRYTFAPEPSQFPCRWRSGCCSRDGVMYLNSCRAPTQEETLAIKSCLNGDMSFRSEEYYGCLRDADVKTGCDVQKDGSRLCY